MKKEQEGKVLTDAQKEEIVDHAIQLIKNGESISKTCEITGISRWLPTLRWCTAVLASLKCFSGTVTTFQAFIQIVSLIYHRSYYWVWGLHQNCSNANRFVSIETGICKTISYLHRRFLVVPSARNCSKNICSPQDYIFA